MIFELNFSECVSLLAVTFCIDNERENKTFDNTDSTEGTMKV